MEEKENKSDNKSIEVWKECLTIIKNVVPEAVYDKWFRPIKPVALEDHTLTLEVPSHTHMRQLEDSLIDILSKTLKRVIGKDVRLKYNVRVVHDSIVTLPHQNELPPTNRGIALPRPERAEAMNPFIIPGLKQLEIDPQLNPKYTFENFIEGMCNRLARSAGEQVAKEPGSGTFNPLFIWGGSGLGKTHLSQAIGLKIKELYPEKIVLYVSANRFMTQYVDAVQVKNKFTDFLHFYQMIDVLIVDDVQEFATKTGTQNAFFHVFNHLHQMRKQLILTSDRAPRDMQELDARLLSRFKWGLSAELTPPDFETRIKILKAKSDLEGIALSDEIIKYIASKVEGNIRELEGTLVSLMAHATLNKEDITLDLAKRVTEQLVVTEQKKEFSLEQIQQNVCDYFKITPEMMLSASRKREIVQARQITMYLVRNFTKLSLASIGSRMGGKNHATVLHACNLVEDLVATDKSVKHYVADLEKQLI